MPSLTPLINSCLLLIFAYTLHHGYQKNVRKMKQVEDSREQYLNIDEIYKDHKSDKSIESGKKRSNNGEGFEAKEVLRN